MNVFDRIGIGLKAWYWAWFVEGGAERIGPAVAAPSRPAIEGPREDAKPAPKPVEPVPRQKDEKARGADAPHSPGRSEALTLLETLQREARLIDFLKEDVTAYQDAQIGAAVRDIHRDAGKVLERLFALRSVLDQPEGSSVALDEKSTGRVRLVGNVRDGAASGTLVHHGWTATKVELPTWSGPPESERVVAPAEVEVA